MKIKMLSIDKSKIINYGFRQSENDWFEKEIPQTFRGTYTLYICNIDIYGIFQGMSTHELELNQFIEKLNFKTPEAAQMVVELLNKMKSDGAINYEEVETK
jgi:hypothetical protein